LAENAGLIIRRNERHDLALPARFAVAPPHREMLRFASSVASRDGWVDCDLIDFSTGGLGVISDVFVPRMARLRIRVYRDEKREELVLEAPVRVQRAVMTDRRPAYLVGTAFEDLERETHGRVEKMLALLGGED